MQFEGLTVVSVKVIIWGVMFCNLVDNANKPDLYLHSRRWRQQVPPKCWHLSAILHSATSQTTVILKFLSL